MRTVALVPAAGKGKRMKFPTSKPYTPLGDKPILAHTLLVLNASPLIDSIYVIVGENDFPICQSQIINRYFLSKVKGLVKGGKERQDSVWEGIKKIGEECDIVLIHDGARPLVTGDILERSIEETKRSGAACAGIPLQDTLKAVDREGHIRRTVEREGLWLIQTPQTFKYHIIKDAYLKAYREGFRGTDDASLVERMGHPVKIILGSVENIKITTSEDLELAECIWRKRSYEEIEQR